MNQMNKIQKQLPKKIVLENTSDAIIITYERYLTNGGTYYKQFFKGRLIDDEMRVGQVIKEVEERLARGCNLRIVK